MTKEELKRAVIAAVLGAAVTFFTHLLEAFTLGSQDLHASLLGGISSAVAYLKMAARIV